MCNYMEMLEAASLSPTPNRVKIFELIGNSENPLRAQEIHDTLRQTGEINRVTVYRILELLVERGLIEKMSSGERSFHFGLAPNEHHKPHPHFYCRRCGSLECLQPETLPVDLQALKKIYPGKIEAVEIRVDGICKQCLRREI
jgi:Fur family ferric uptake transcriptional regulator